MTRGTVYLISDKYIIETQEFNGDMYLDARGGEVLTLLENVYCLKTFKKEIIKFNKDNFDYNCQLFYPKELNYFMKNKTIEMTDENYFKKFFSDWTFWKNISNKEMRFKTRDNVILSLKPKEQIAINFGKSSEHVIILNSFCLNEKIL